MCVLAIDSQDVFLVQPPLLEMFEMLYCLHVSGLPCRLNPATYQYHCAPHHRHPSNPRGTTVIELFVGPWISLESFQQLTVRILLHA